MRRLQSITFRIIILHIVAITAAAVALPFSLKFALDRVVSKLQSDAISEEIEWLAQHLQRLPDGRVALNVPSGLHGLYSSAYGRYAYAILDENGRVLSASSSLGGNTPLFPYGKELDTTDDQPIQLMKVERDGRTIEGAAKQTFFDGQFVTIQLGEDPAHRDVVLDDVTSRFLKYVTLVTIPVLLALLLADIFIVNSATRTLRILSARAKEISPLNTGVRLPTTNTPLEIRPLVHAVNQALDRLDKGFIRQRQFTADTAHELRTPLAVLRARIETLPDQTHTKKLLRDIERMSRVVSQSLELAEVEAMQVNPDEKAELNQVCHDVAELLATIAIRQNKSIELSQTDQPVLVRGDQDALGRAVRNLVENAIRHTADGTAVEITVGQDGSVSVLDSGKGLDASMQDVLFKRFGPRDQQRTGGAGLGLAIVKTIIESYGGSITVQNRKDGGAQFTLHCQLVKPA